jgi:hypothetical protein
MTIQVAWPLTVNATRDVYLAFGDSMCAGRGNIAEVPAGYPPASGLFAVKDAAIGHAVLVEPTGDAPGGAAAGVGPWGMLGWLIQQQTGRETCVVNTGVGSTTSSQWVPGQTNYINAIGRLGRALSREGTVLRGIFCYMGPNDAVSATPPWLANVQSILAGFRTYAGRTAAQAPAIISRLTTQVPTDTSYPGWSYVQSAITSIADANHVLITPPSPATREAYFLHHTAAQNYAVAQSALTALMSHASWG